MQLLFILPPDTISSHDKHVKKGDAFTLHCQRLLPNFFGLFFSLCEDNLLPQDDIQYLRSPRAVA